jgi:uncharacterized membrane protein YeaQ/YmgE (transglycosylase-associated protein family)
MTRPMLSTAAAGRLAAIAPGRGRRVERTVNGEPRKRLATEGSVMEIIGVIVAGIIIGLLGKFVAPGSRDNTPLWLTILCGIGGVLIGWFIYSAFGGNGSPGIDWVRWLIAIAVAAVLVVVASTVTGRNTTKV